MKNFEKEILIIGGSGYLGSNLKRILKHKKLLSTHNLNSNKDSIYFDLLNSDISDVLLNYPNISTIIILGGVVKFSKINENLLLAYDVNVLATKKLLKKIKDKNIFPIYFSSESVFDGLKGNYIEEDKPNPTFEYARHKYEIEKFILENFSKYQILRLSKVFDSNLSGNTLIVNWVNQIKNKENIFCANNNIFTPIHLDDLCKILKILISNLYTGIFHLSSQLAFNRKEMLEMLIRRISTKSDCNVKIKYQSLNSFKGTEDQPLNTSLNPNKLIQITGITPKSYEYWLDKIIHKMNYIEK